MEKARTQGIAIAIQLAFDGGAALFFQPDSPNAVDRLANTVHAAHAALRVSGDFDAA
jgi:HAMP domain-containing protein